MSPNNRYKFFPFMLERIDYARSHGIPRFKVTHWTGDPIYVTLTNGSVRMVRWRYMKYEEDDPRSAVGDGEWVKAMTLTTTDAQMHQDLKTGPTSKLGELLFDA